jgi:ankyrin repeat protein
MKTSFIVLFIFMPEQLKCSSGIVLLTSSCRYRMRFITIGLLAIASRGIGASLIEAATNGWDKRVVEELIASGGVDLNESDTDGSTALINSILNRYEDIAELLIEKGADVNKVGYQENSALKSASRSGYLRLAALLIEKGANVNHVDKSKRTALMEAAMNGHSEIAELLISRGANMDIVDFQDRSALMLAILGGHADVAKLLIRKGANVNLADKVSGRTALMFTIQGGKFAIAKTLLQSAFSKYSRDDKILERDVNPIFRELVKLLIEHGAKVDQVEDRGGRSPLNHAIEAGYTEIARMLIESGADVNRENGSGYIPLHSAISGRNMECTNLLIQYGADVNRVYGDNKTPLYLATSNFEMKREISRALILAGARDVRVEDSPYLREKHIEPLIGPLHLIREAAAQEIAKPFKSIDSSGISPIQGFITFAFERAKLGLNSVFNDIVALLKEEKWTPSQIESISSIISDLVTLRCTDLNVLYSVAPFIEGAGEEDITKLYRVLEFLTNRRTSGPVLNGQLLNELIHRSSPVGFKPVLEALSAMLLRREFVLADPLPSLDINSKVYEFSDFRAEAMKELIKAI